MKGVRIAILGPLEVRDAAGHPAPLAGPRLRALLIRLAVAGGHAVTVDRLASDLWPDERPEERPADPANALQALVSRLRQAAGRDLVEHGQVGGLAGRPRWDSGLGVRAGGVIGRRGGRRHGRAAAARKENVEFAGGFLGGRGRIRHGLSLGRQCRLERRLQRGVHRR